MLSGALLLGILVVAVFWQNSLIQAEAERIRLLMGRVELNLADTYEHDALAASPGLRDVLRREVGGDAEFLDLVLFDGTSAVHSSERVLLPSVEQVVRNSSFRGHETIVLQGLSWAVLTPGRQMMIVARPVVLGGVKKGALAAAVDLRPLYKKLRGDFRLVGLYLLLNIVVFSVVGLYRMISLVLRPIERMVTISESYSVTGGTYFSGGSGSEFGRLSMALNSMLLRIEMDRNELRRTVQSLAETNDELRRVQNEVVRAEKFAAVGRLSAGLAHEIGNPLGIVHGYVELLRQPDLSSDDRRQFAERALSELNRIDRLIRRLLDFTRSQPRQNEAFVLREIVREVTDMFADQVRRAGIELVVEGDCHTMLMGDRDGLKQVLINCVLNSIDAIEMSGKRGGGKICVQIVEKKTSDDDRWVTISVSDNGVGIDVVDKSLLFEPFFTTKEPGRGTGLGLSVSHTIVEAHGGRMNIDGTVGNGATVTIELPIKN